jgi:hypothetical protein
LGTLAVERQRYRVQIGVEQIGVDAQRHRGIGVPQHPRQRQPLIAVALVVALVLVGKTIGRLRNRRGLDGGAVERWPTKDVLTEIVAEVWHSDQQHKATKERRKRVGKAQKHQSES